MKNTIITKLSLVLIIVMMVSLASCNLIKHKVHPDTWDEAIYKEDTELGTGAKTVIVDVIKQEKKVTFTIHTDAKTLGEALIDHGLVEGEDSQFGLYIKKVNGMTADYDIDQSYWGFYQNGEYMISGVDTTEINGGERFELVYEK